MAVTDCAMPSLNDEDDPDLLLAHMKLEIFELKGKLQEAEGRATDLESSNAALTDQR